MIQHEQCRIPMAHLAASRWRCIVVQLMTLAKVGAVNLLPLTSHQRISKMAGNFSRVDNVEGKELVQTCEILCLELMLLANYITLKTVVTISSDQIT